MKTRDPTWCSGLLVAFEETPNLSRYTGFFPTRRGGRTLVLNGYHYRLDKSIANRTAWKCKVYGCRSRCITNESNQIVKSTKTQMHNHAVDWQLLQRQFHSLLAETPEEVYPLHFDETTQPQDTSTQPPQHMGDDSGDVLDSDEVVVKIEYDGVDESEDLF
ncbi:hypothetical protein ACOMHN_036021 [Nucella lapillus]